MNDNKQMNDIMNIIIEWYYDTMKRIIVKSLEESGLLIKGVRETIQKKAKGQKGGFLWMLLDSLGASLLGNLLIGKSTIRARKINLEQERALLKQASIFNAILSFNNFWNKKLLSKWT